MANFDAEKVRRFVMRVEFIPYVVLSAIGLAVLYVVGTIVVGAVHNHGLIPPPTKLERYDCSAPVGDFSLFYLHGTDRVQIKSAKGMLEGAVHQNVFDWQGFGDDRTMLGFAPPTDILFEDMRSLRVKGADLQDVICNHVGDTSAHQRTLSN